MIREVHEQRDPRPAIYLYSQSFDHGGRTFHRRGLIALVKLSPFGAGEVVPHELTHKGPIEDRLKLMRATGVQLSPIFGLFSDPGNKVTQLLYQHAGRPMLSGTLDGVQNDLWSVNVERSYHEEFEVTSKNETTQVAAIDGAQAAQIEVETMEAALVAAADREQAAQVAA